MILVPNVPWLKSGTVKENILFGSAYRKDDYESVIDACGLREDFKRLPLKDRVRHSLGMGNMGQYEAKDERSGMSLIAMQPLVADQAFMPHMKAMYVPFHMAYSGLICSKGLQSDRPK